MVDAAETELPATDWLIFIASSPREITESDEASVRTELDLRTWWWC